MQYLLLFSLSLFLFVACENAPGKEVEVKGKAITLFPVSTEQIKGMYTGEFRGSPINIVLTAVSEKRASGYNVHMGQHRNLTGVVEFDSSRLHLFLFEPGDSRFDGKFHLAIDTATWKGKGTWQSFVSGKEIPFQFRKRQIRKEGEGQVFVNAQANYITLRPDGSCEYNFLDDSVAGSQPVIIKGRHKKEKGKLAIVWEKNKVLSQSRSVFNLIAERPVKGDVFVLQSLRNEKEVFNEMVFD